MMINLVVGICLILACATIQSVNLATILVKLEQWQQKGHVTADIKGLATVLITLTLIILAGVLLQIALWASVFLALGEFQAFPTAFYHSVVNYTSLGYGDIVLSDRYRLLGAMEAINGVLMIGLSTGVMFAVVNIHLNTIWNSRQKPSG